MDSLRETLRKARAMFPALAAEMDAATDAYHALNSGTKKAQRAMNRQCDAIDAFTAARHAAGLYFDGETRKA